MKVLLYSNHLDKIGKSGLGKAIKHQEKALKLRNIDYTKDLNDDYDILHINTYFPKDYFLVKKAKRKGKKILYHAHSTKEDFLNSFIGSNLVAPIFKWWISKCYSLGDIVVTPTPYSKRLLKSYKKLKNKKIYAISNGIESGFFKEDKSLNKDFRKRYNIKEDDKLIIGIGLYIERKGIIDFVELARRLPEYKFIWFGYSNPKASPKKVRDALNTNLDNLQFPGYVEREEIKAALNSCDLFIFPTLEETEGIPIIEACACKTPLLIRDIEIFEDWLKDGVNVYKAKDLDEFYEKTKLIVEGKLKDLGDEAIKVADERKLENVAKSLEKVYKELMEE